ncbi:MAG: acylphosphatase [Aggregatilineales bacterium]
MQRLHAIISGRVQGVSFRYTTQQEAQKLGISGWVRNRPERTVEVTAEGERDKLDALLAFLYHGPPAAKVENVQATWSDGTGEFDDFQITYFR